MGNAPAGISRRGVCVPGVPVPRASGLRGTSRLRTGHAQSIIATMGRSLPRNVKALGLVSLANDTASDMVIPLLPAFVTGVLGHTAAFLGTLEGIAESTASLLKLFAGWYSDRLRRRKAFALAGYGLSNLVRPLIGIANAGWQVLGLRFADRVGKGIRTSPRDALLAEAVSPEDRGRAFGFQRAFDNVGAVAGPLLAWLLLLAFPGRLRLVFLLSVVPGIEAWIILATRVKEEAPMHGPEVGGGTPPAAAASDTASARPLEATAIAAAGGARTSASPLAGGLPRGAFRTYLFAVILFTLGNSSDVFLALRAQDLGIPLATIPIVWMLLSLVRALTTTPGGQLSDRIGRRPAIISGWFVYALAYAGFAFAREAWHIWVLFLFYGLYYGLVEGPERALVADLVPAEIRGRAYGWFHLCVGIGALPASLLFGLIWREAGAAHAFAFGAVMALLAALALLLMRGPRRDAACG
jgi:MFS family permease